MTENGNTTTAGPVSPEGGASRDLVEAEVNLIRNPALIEMRREQLLDAALALFLEKGFAATTIRDICARSGVNQASIYDYVANKQDILRRLLNRLWFRSSAPTLPERLADPEGPPLEEILRAFFTEGWNARRDGTMLAYRAVPHLDAQDRRALHERERHLLESLSIYLRKHTGAASDDERVEVVANFIIFSNAFAPLRDWLTRDIDQKTEMRTVIDGIMAMVDRLRVPEP
ncbi:TetR/AcrR family transcriptional regulator [Pikeienuella piscinae]|uniref:TetR/AcrR family transcriptional regulator n=1 Tax=Pikeienuella piscinae TaxID=2748098 RepID=UPI001FE3AAB5|nr:TetR/AcrR family transcriptional regulator [Pikeienuella piscinae]